MLLVWLLELAFAKPPKTHEDTHNEALPLVLHNHRIKRMQTLHNQSTA
jgi:hypothetical protein